MPATIAPPSISDPVRRARTPVMLALMGLSIGGLVLAAFVLPGWQSAAAWGLGFTAVYAGYALVRRDAVVGRMLAFGVAAGVAELAADHWLVAVTGSLVYPPQEPMVFSSPAYMPFAWAVVLVQVGYLGWLIGRRWGWVRAGLSVAVIGGALVPLYEYLAIAAGWWDYRDVAMLFGTVPAYIPLAEALLMLPVPFLLHRALHVHPLWILLLGLAEGFAMWAACLIAYPLLG